MILIIIIITILTFEFLQKDNLITMLPHLSWNMWQQITLAVLQTITTQQVLITTFQSSRFLIPWTSRSDLEGSEHPALLLVVLWKCTSNKAGCRNESSNSSDVMSTYTYHSYLGLLITSELLLLWLILCVLLEIVTADN